MICKNDLRAELSGYIKQKKGILDSADEDYVPGDIIFDFDKNNINTIILFGLLHGDGFQIPLIERKGLGQLDWETVSTTGTEFKEECISKIKDRTTLGCREESQIEIVKRLSMILI